MRRWRPQRDGVYRRPLRKAAPGGRARFARRRQRRCCAQPLPLRHLSISRAVALVDQSRSRCSMLRAFVAEIRMPDFTQLVRETVPRIPPGRVLTYSCLAALAGNPNAPGNVSLGEPGTLHGWHRVVTKHGTLQGDYAPEQRRLLESEGVDFDGDRIVGFDRHFWRECGCRERDCGLHGGNETYTKPDDVTAPRDHWSLVGVLRDGGAGEPSYAVGLWDGEVRIACRWNGRDGRPHGNPVSSGHPTWMVLEPAVNQGIVQGAGLVEALLDLVAEQHFQLRA